MASRVLTKRAGAVGAEGGGEPLAAVYTRIHSLLYTLRGIAQREDQLCILMHHLRTTGRLTAGLAAELREIAEEIPAEEYMGDLEALRASLDAAGVAPAAGRGRGGSKRRAA